MFQIERKLRCEAAAVLPSVERGIWFTGLNPQSERWRRVLVELLWLQERDPGGQAFQIRCGDAIDLIWCGSEACRCEPTLGGMPLSDRANALESAGLWLPCNASVWPPLELEPAELPEDSIHFWHPVHGLLRLEDRDRFDALGGFAFPRSSSRQWSSPPEVATRFPVIRDLRADEEPDLNAFLEQGNQDIGADADRLGEATLDDTPGALAKAKRKFLQWIDGQSSDKRDEKLEKAPQDSTESGRRKGSQPAGSHGSSSKGIGGMIQTVSRSIAERLSERLRAERERQIEKLLDWMKTDPDRALRFALPLGGDGGFRGFAMPGAKLFEQTPNFSLSGLGGGGPVDAWALRFDLQERLQASYREQLNRAKAAGQHRRAAYIAAHLLGDFRLAAVCLENGGHYSEAAVLYRDKLRQPQDAARCFAGAGQWEQAVELYRNTGELEKAGDLLREVGEEQAAIEAYEDAAARLVKSDRVLEAAELIDTKLGRRDAVLQLLWSQWPDGNEPVATATRAFELMAEQGEHEEALHRLNWLGESAGPEDALARAMIYQAVSQQTPDERVRLEAEDACRVAAVTSIEQASPMEVDQRMELVASLSDPHQLIARDARRYSDKLRQDRAASRRSEPTPIEPPERKRKRGVVSLELDRVDKATTHRLDRVVFADHLANSLRLIGMRGKHCEIVTNFSRTGDQGRVRIEGMTEELLIYQHFMTCDRPPCTLLLAGANPEGLPLPSLPPGVLSSFRSPIGEADDLVINSTGQIAGLSLNSGNVSFGRVVDGKIVHEDTLSIASRLQDIWTRYGYEALSTVRLLAVDREILLIGGEMVGRLDGHQTWIDSLRSAPKRIDASLPWTRKRFAVVDEGGVVVYWLDGDSLGVDVVAEGEYQSVKLLHGGLLLAVTEQHLELFQATRNGYVRRDSVRYESFGRIVAILPRAHQFVIVYDSGEIQYWKIAK
ncbi:MAG: hypothetical protein AAFX06_07470 [Planctomycetota bacterium]